MTIGEITLDPLAFPGFNRENELKLAEAIARLSRDPKRPKHRSRAERRIREERERTEGVLIGFDTDSDSTVDEQPSKRPRLLSTSPNPAPPFAPDRFDAEKPIYYRSRSPLTQSFEESEPDASHPDPFRRQVTADEGFNRRSRWRGHTPDMAPPRSPSPRRPNSAMQAIYIPGITDAQRTSSSYRCLAALQEESRRLSAPSSRSTEPYHAEALVLGQKEDISTWLSVSSPLGPTQHPASSALGPTQPPASSPLGPTQQDYAIRPSYLPHNDPDQPATHASNSQEVVLAVETYMPPVSMDDGEVLAAETLI